MCRLLRVPFIFVTTIHVQLYCIIFVVNKAGRLNVITKWQANAIKEYSLASQSERVPQSCFYGKVACLSYGEYSLLFSQFLLFAQFLESFSINYCSKVVINTLTILLTKITAAQNNRA